MAKILIVSPTPSHPPDAGNRARIRSLLEGMKAAGHHLSFVFVLMEGGDERVMRDAWDDFTTIPYWRPADRRLKSCFDRWAKRLGSSAVLPYGIDDWYTPEISRSLGEICREFSPDVVLVEYVFLSKALTCFGSDTLKILDTHDIFGDRHRMYLANGMAPQWFYTTVAGEQAGLARADVVVAIQPEEAAYFSRMTSRKVITVGHLATSPSAAPAEPLPNRLLFVGSANQINVVAARWFIDEVLPLLQRVVPDVELEIAGACAGQIEPAAGLLLTGQVDDLAPCYREARVVVNPVRFGTGLKIKTVEAFSYGKPLVTTSAGAAGLISEQELPCAVADTPEEFSACILKFLNSAELSQKAGRAALEFAESYNRQALAPLLVEIDNWMARRASGEIR